MDRRNFIKSSFAVTAHPILSVAPTFFDTVSQLGENLKLAVVGCGSWGRRLFDGVLAIPGVESIDLCEIQLDKLAESVSVLSAQTQIQIRSHTDLVSMLKSRRPHVTIVATPDHLRAEHAILALRHGSHVMTGESAGLTLLENNRVLEASKRANREVQLSFPLRLEHPNNTALAFLKSGLAGKISEVRAYSFSSGNHSVESSAKSSIPSAMHEKWSGSIPLLPQDISLMEGGWRNSEAHSLGVIGRHGIPLLDFVMQWAGSAPDVIYAMGGVTRSLAPSWASAARPSCPDFLLAHFSFEVCRVTWEHRHIVGSGPWKRSSGIYFHGSLGIFHLNADGSWTFTPTGASSATVCSHPVESLGDTPSASILQKFIQKLREGRPAYPTLESGNQSASLAILVHQSLMENAPVAWERPSNYVM